MIKIQILLFILFWNTLLANCMEEYLSYSHYAEKSIIDYTYTKADIEGFEKLNIAIKYIPTQIHPLRVSICVTNPLNYTIHFSHFVFPSEAIDNCRGGVIFPYDFKILEDGKTISPLFSFDSSIIYEDAALALPPYESYQTYINLGDFYNIHKGTHYYEVDLITNSVIKSNTLNFVHTINQKLFKNNKIAQTKLKITTESTANSKSIKE